MTKKKQVGVRFDSNRTRLKTGETQRPNGTYAYRWSTPDGKRHSIYRDIGPVAPCKVL